MVTKVKISKIFMVRTILLKKIKNKNTKNKNAQKTFFQNPFGKFPKFLSIFKFFIFQKYFSVIVMNYHYMVYYKQSKSRF
jgi:hypothetical protein